MSNSFTFKSYFVYLTSLIAEEAFLAIDSLTAVKSLTYF
jgi:hypothetical protein